MGESRTLGKPMQQGQSHESSAPSDHDPARLELIGTLLNEGHNLEDSGWEYSEDYYKPQPPMCVKGTLRECAKIWLSWLSREDISKERPSLLAIWDKIYDE